jgi:hypothetical protein
MLFAITVAGKSAKHAEGAIKRLFQTNEEEREVCHCGMYVDEHTQSENHTAVPMVRLPMERIVLWLHTGQLEDRLRAARTGNYTKLAKAFAQIAPKVNSGELDLRTCAADDLETIHGVGPKTSRFFITWTRPNARHAVLDVHILRWLRQRGHDVPASTPASQKRYAEIEEMFLKIADEFGSTPRELDAAIWAAGSGHEDWSPDEQIAMKTLFDKVSRKEG